MKFKLDTNINLADFNIKHGDGIVMLGSCFSDNMSSYFENSGFNVLSNPFGTLFHPLPIDRVINQAFDDDVELNAFKRDELWLSWGASSKLYGETKDELNRTVSGAKVNLKNALLNARLLVITFGSAWGYSHQEFGTVANCHKMPSSLFNKDLSTVEEMQERWSGTLSTLKKLNPNLSIVFTVSPVRHKKDGLVENNRSKSRLIELSHRLASDFGSYFPSYEIVIDELRDYRFYKSDLVHPSDDAIGYVWNRFKDYIFTEETESLIKQIEKVNSTLAHKSLHPNLEADNNRIEKGQELKSRLSQKHQEIYWK